MDQLELPAVHREVDTIEMGILSDGTPYLSMRALAGVVGVHHSVIADWLTPLASKKDALTPRDRHLIEYIRKAGGDEGHLYREIEVKGSPTYAVPDIVCMGVVEYYAFESTPPRPQALDTYRKLAIVSMRAFIYRSLGYDPDGVPPKWRQFHDRVLLVGAPAGYFCVFTEMSGMVVELMKHGLVVDEHTVPDISVGKTWGDHWTNNLETAHAPRIRFDHNYPDYFPQSATNPQQPWAYPDSALGEFRRWMREVYLPTKFPNYLREKVKRGTLPKAALPALLALAVPPVLTSE